MLPNGTNSEKGSGIGAAKTTHIDVGMTTGPVQDSARVAGVIFEGSVLGSDDDQRDRVNK